MAGLREKLIAGITGSVIAGAALYGLEGGKEGEVAYRDQLIKGRVVITYCSGKTGTEYKVGHRFTANECKVIDQATLKEYGTHIVDCIGEKNLTLNQGIGMTLFAVNVGKAAACNSAAARYFRAAEPAKGCYSMSNSLATNVPVWSYVNGTQLVWGLYDRRHFERALCESNKTEAELLAGRTPEQWFADWQRENRQPRK